MQNRFAFIDGLRGMAAIAVMLFHALRGHHLEIAPYEIVSLVTVGESGVVIFFVISGFVITNSLLRSNFGLDGILPFILCRSIRLDPPYWASIGLALSFSALAAAVVPGRPPTEYSVGQLGAHLFYLQDLFGYAQINMVFWTLCYEMQFYAVIALLIALRSNRLLVLVFVASLLWPLELIPSVRGLFVNLFYSFLLGVGACYALQRRGTRPWFLAYVVAIVLAAIVKDNLVGYISTATAAVLFYVALIGRLATLLNWRWIQFLGMISYSLYLTHNPITGAIFRVWYMVAGNSPGSQLVGLALAVAACILFAWIAYMVIERPCIALARLTAKRVPWTLPFGRRGKTAESHGFAIK